MNVLVVGSGGREHAILWKLAQSPLVKKIFCAPGNGGISLIADCLPVKADDLPGLLNIVKEKKIDLTIVGPEVPLTLGITNLFEKNHYPIFGPSKEAAEIEGSKVFSKRLMEKYHIPSGRYRTFNDFSEAICYIKKESFPLVVKVDGLAAGKGVFIVQDFIQAQEIIDQIMNEKSFGSAGTKIVIEEYLTGEEISVLAFTDGNHFIPMISSQDHKKIYDGDNGPNTGGMGAYSPAPFFSNEQQDWISEHIFQPVIQGMRREGRIFKGVLYAGLILTENGPKVLEFNARFGDPETQVILPLLETDLMDIIHHTLTGRLDQFKIHWKKQSSVCVIMASRGYPDQYTCGQRIKGLNNFKNRDDLIIFHAGTSKNGDDFVTFGGRVLGVTAWADHLTGAIEKAYEGIQNIYFDGQHYRKDIGQKGLKLSSKDN